MWTITGLIRTMGHGGVSAKFGGPKALQQTTLQKVPEAFSRAKQPVFANCSRQLQISQLRGAWRWWTRVTRVMDNLGHELIQWCE